MGIPNRKPRRVSQRAETGLGAEPFAFLADSGEKSADQRADQILHAESREPPLQAFDAPGGAGEEPPGDLRAFSTHRLKDLPFELEDARRLGCDGACRPGSIE